METACSGFINDAHLIVNELVSSHKASKSLNPLQFFNKSEVSENFCNEFPFKINWIGGLE